MLRYSPFFFKLFFRLAFPLDFRAAFVIICIAGPALGLHDHNQDA